MMKVTIPSAHPGQISSRSASLCHNVVSHKKSKKTTKSQKSILATQPKPDFSKTCGFREVLDINEVCLNEKFHRNH